MLVLEHPAPLHGLIKVGEDGVEKVELVLGEAGHELVVLLEGEKHDGDVPNLPAHHSYGVAETSGEHGSGDQRVEQVGALFRSETQALFDGELLLGILILQIADIRRYDP